MLTISRFGRGLTSDENKHGCAIKTLFFIALTLLIGSTQVGAKEMLVSEIAYNIPDLDNEKTAGIYKAALTKINTTWTVNFHQNVSQTVDSPLTVKTSYARLKFSVKGKGDIVFYIKPKDLYVVGYMVGGRYYAIEGQPIPTDVKDIDIVRLKFTADYPNLGDSHGTQRTSIMYSWMRLSDALKPLFNNHPAPSEDEAKKALLTVIPMFVEGARFQYSIGDKIYSNIAVYKGQGEPGAPGEKPKAPLGNAEIELMNNWSALSKFGFSIVDKPDTKPITIDNVVYSSFADVSKKVAIFLITQKGSVGSQKAESSYSVVSDAL